MISITPREGEGKEAEVWENQKAQRGVQQSTKGIARTKVEFGYYYL